MGGNRTLLCAYFLCSYMDRVDKTLREPAIGHSIFREISSCESYRCGHSSIATLRNCSSSDLQTKHFVSYVFPYPPSVVPLACFLLLPALCVGSSATQTSPLICCFRGRLRPSVTGSGFHATGTLLPVRL